MAIIGPLRRLNDTAHNEPYALAVDLPDCSAATNRSSALAFHWERFPFPFLERDWATFDPIAEAIHNPHQWS